jgi:hypothetical protein
VPYIRAFLAAAKGDPEVPVHYPRVRPPGMDDPSVPVPADPRGQAYEWFVQNDRLQRDGDAVSLPPADGAALPVHSARGGGSRGG